MFGLSFTHIILLSAIALIFIGPKQLPEVARTIGRFINEMRRVGGDLTKSMVEARDQVDQQRQNIHQSIHDTKPADSNSQDQKKV